MFQCLAGQAVRGLEKLDNGELRSSFQCLAGQAVSARHSKGDDDFEAVTDTLWTAAGDVLSSVDLLVTGHIHFTEALTFDGHPSQLVLGGGGTKLTKDVKGRHVTGQTIGGWTVTSARIIDDFGYATVKEEGTNVWRLNVYGTDGSRQMKCSIDGATMKCRKLQ